MKPELHTAGGGTAAPPLQASPLSGRERRPWRDTRSPLVQRGSLPTEALPDPRPLSPRVLQGCAPPMARPAPIGGLGWGRAVQEAA